MIHCVAYLRLSKEDEREGESGSITNQRKIIQDYCMRNGIVLVKEFVDDDYSGGNFDRPGFKAMIEYLKNNKQITAVITKDLSRLGRDMTESSYYAERYFPEHNIRYLAIDDSFDSERENMLAPFQFAMNDMYIRDASKKVRNAFQVMMNRGEYCFRAPYGYQKDREDLHHLVPNPATAPVVQSIFSMAASGASVGKIAEALTSGGIKPPLLYRVDELESRNSGNKAYASQNWNASTVRRIIQNPVYLGHTVLGKSKKISPKSAKKRPVPRDHWKVTENTHAALVDAETFDLAARNLHFRSSDYRQHDHVRKSIFGGIVFCATCGAAMCSSGTVYHGEREKYWYLSCQNIPERSRRRCPDGARIKYSALVELVTQDLKAVVQLTPEQRNTAVERAIQSANTNSGMEEMVKMLSAARTRLAAIDQIVSKLYEDMYLDQIPRERALSMLGKYEEESRELNRQIGEGSERMAKLRDTKDLYDRFFALADRITGFETLTRDILLSFIRRIEVGPRRYEDGKQHGPKSKVAFTQEVKIYYHFIDNAVIHPAP